ncbi:MAG: hypothetical protein II711_00790 [Clostridia bacterium]|nr:hypothetical protein [Clostridia bacterium]
MLTMKDEQQNAADTLPKENWLSVLLKKDALLKLIVFVGIAGIALLFLSSTMSSSSSESSSGEVSAAAAADIDITQYRNELCEELGNMLASIDGVGRTKIMLTLDGTVRNIYATDNDYQQKETSAKGTANENADKQSNEKKTCIVMRQKDGSEKALTVGQLMPAIKGVLVVCDGGDDREVCARVVSAVSAALNISDAHICVTKMNS